jgi:hypothetical protein
VSILLLALALQAQSANSLSTPSLSKSPYDPEIEAIMRRRDEARQRAAMDAAAQKQEAAQFAAAMPPEIAARLSACLGKADNAAETGISDAESWAKEGGGAYAAQCKGYALGKAARWGEAVAAFETGAVIKGLDAVAQARLWAQAGNAALIGGDVPRALSDFDRAFDLPLPATLSTGELYLDRARARVAAGDLPGARGDLSAALSLASGDPLAWLLSATLARRMDDLPLAIAHIERAAAMARTDANVALEQGVIYALSGTRDPAARAAFTRARELDKGGDIARRADAYLAQLPQETPARP